MADRPRGFTLIELLVVIGIIALLISILLPVINKARAASRTAYCLSNLHTMGLAFAMYADEKGGHFPYPETSLGTPPGKTSAVNDESDCWFNALDPYLQRAQPDLTRTGVARDRTYSQIKQCIIWQDFVDTGTGAGTAEGTEKEAARTYKMNAYLRHGNYTHPVPYTAASYPDIFAKVTDVRHPANFVLLGDGISLDITGPIPGQHDSEQFCMGLNDKTETYPALRHGGGADILFVDGHAATIVLHTNPSNLSYAPKTAIQVWEGEYLVNNKLAGPPNPADSIAQQTKPTTRNPDMPLEWSVLGKLYISG
jgi:prepilin-type N-terminal cleavage/methylation domain-containing protein/prepilin-type processing-associated H-X9-DG protein